MVLTTLRMMDTGRFADTVECADEDFETTIGIISTLNELFTNFCSETYIRDGDRPGILPAPFHLKQRQKAALAYAEATFLYYDV